MRNVLLSPWIDKGIGRGWIDVMRVEEKIYYPYSRWFAIRGTDLLPFPRMIVEVRRFLTDWPIDYEKQP